MLLYLINPCNELTSLINIKRNRLSKYLLWKPLGLLVLAGLTPAEWEIKIIDEEVEVPNYSLLPRPDLVGITAFTSQAPRAYKIATGFRSRNIPVVMGGIHATMCYTESLAWTDSVVIGEAESVWHLVLNDVKTGKLKQTYRGKRVSLDKMPEARHDLLSRGYKIGSIQTTRGCPLNCIFCSVSEFNGKIYRYRPIDNVIKELINIKEKQVLFVDDNLIGVNKSQIDRAKELFREIIKAKIKKRFIAQVTLNMAEDDELLRIASKAGLVAIFVGFESIKEAGLLELEKKFNIRKNYNFKTSINKIKAHGIVVLGSFIIGLDDDNKEIGVNIAKICMAYGIDILNLVFLTPLPGTRLWKKYLSENRIAASNFPEDWKYYTLTLPVANYMHLSWAEIFNEQTLSYHTFYSYRRILRRFFHQLLINRKPISSIIILIANLDYKHNMFLKRKIFQKMDTCRGISYV